MRETIVDVRPPMGSVWGRRGGADAETGILAVAAVLLVAVGLGTPTMADVELLNVSYDPTQSCTETSTKHSPPTGDGGLASR